MLPARQRSFSIKYKKFQQQVMDGEPDFPPAICCHMYGRSTSYFAAFVFEKGEKLQAKFSNRRIAPCKAMGIIERISGCPSFLLHFGRYIWIRAIGRMLHSNCMKRTVIKSALWNRVQNSICAMNATHVSCPMAFDTTKYFVIPASTVILAAWLLLNCLALFCLAVPHKEMHCSFGLCPE